MLDKSLFVLAWALALAGLHAAAHGGDLLWDPVVTHTYGMPLASSERCRSHNVYWRCDPYRHSYCDGRMNCPCVNSALGRQPFPGRPTCGPGGLMCDFGGVGGGWGSQDGLEPVRGERLGMIPTDSAATGPRQALGPAADASGGSTLRVLGFESLPTP